MTEMSPLERLMCLVMDEKPDRVPVIPGVISYAPKLLGVSYKDFYADGDLYFETLAGSQIIHKTDWIPVWVNMDSMAEAFGAKLKVPEDYEGPSNPYVQDHLVKTIDDIDKLEVPDFTQPLKAPFSIIDKFIPRCLEIGYPACFLAGSGFTAASIVADASVMLRWMFKEPEAVHRLLRKTNEMLMGAIEYFSEKYGGPNILPFFAATNECNKLISPKMYKEFVHPYTLEMHQKYKDLGIEAVFFHGCSDHRKNIPFFIELREALDWSGKYIWHCGSETPFQTLIDAFGSHDIVAGNIATAVAQTNDYEVIVENCKEIIETGKSAKSGFILSTECELPAIISPLTVAAMVDAANEYGLLQNESGQPTTTN